MPGPKTFHDTITRLHESYRHNPLLNDALRRDPLLHLSANVSIRRSGDQCRVLSNDPFHARIVLAIFYQEPSVHYVIWSSPDHAKSMSSSFVSDSRDTFVTLLFDTFQQRYSEHMIMFQRSRLSMDILYYLCEHPGIHPLFHDKLGVVVDLESDSDVEYSYLFTIYRKNNLSISPKSLPCYFLRNRIVENSSKPIIFQTWLSHTTENEHISRCYHKILNMYPDHSYYLFSDFEMKAFIRQHYDEKVCAQYDNIVPTAFKSDFFRYLFLYRYGGLYLDISVEPVLPLFDFLADFYPASRYQFVSAKDNGLKNGIWNGFMYCEPQHPIMKLCIERIMQRTGKNDGACLDYTGPSLLGGVLSSYNSSHVSPNVLLLEFKDSMYIRDPWTKQNLFAPKNKSKKAISLTRNMYKESKKKHYSAHCLYDQIFLFP